MAKKAGIILTYSSPPHIKTEELMINRQDVKRGLVHLQVECDFDLCANKDSALMHLSAGPDAGIVDD
ncbi:hypothetical protein SARC_05234 [Sphaeroforma arctica JP610]|uniref:Uncharacterized protein n=1 Tax=Sphaeroforma arctica JP610 TaxID=667725 RepID=A0A0L0G038_9EUKA|nr:hypothetical protein SARC_05234 [Sphaeroforma arctica JP610]KNC82482.1 hypothetical protein SARC_05234 [Sphaeroforma arctica JP610]|eukprot:XP_014156384.1 hypothetical protein SARC_05234 [Sphaeroforma arctica JP610]